MKVLKTLLEFENIRQTFLETDSIIQIPLELKHTNISRKR